MMKKVGGIVLLAVIAMPGLFGAENLLTNGALKLIDPAKGGNRPAGWYAPKKTSGSMENVEAAELGEGMTALEVTIDHPGDGQRPGYITSSIKVVTDKRSLVGKRLKLTGQMKGTKDKLAYMAIRLMKGKKIIKNVRSTRNTTTWSEVTVEADVGEADSIMILCRYEQKPAYMDHKAWFADLKLTAE